VKRRIHDPKAPPVHALPLPRFAPGRTVRPAVLVEAALWLLLAVQAARLAWIFLEPVGPVGAAAPASTIGAVPPMPLAALQDPFYRSSNDAGHAAPAGLDGYRLHGVRIGVQPSAAIIGHDGRQRAYRTGDTIAPGVLLAAVGGDHVLLQTGQGPGRLDLATAGPGPAAGDSARLLPAAQPTAGASGTSVEPAQLLAQAGLRAHEDGGYALIPRGDDSALRRAGLQAGDVLLAVDGQPLTPERLAELQQHLSGRTGATLSVRRDGVVRTVALGGAGE
jgi:general secretion pathway protein C